MLLIPIHHPKRPGTFDLLIVLEDENLARMRDGDPANFMPETAEAGLATKPIRTIVIASEGPHNIAHLKELAAAGDLRGILKLINRGFEHRPEQGDGEPPTTIRGRRH